jgi:hypothetical protein
MRFGNVKLMMSYRRVRLWEVCTALKHSDTYLSDRLNGRREFAPHERTRLAEYFGVGEDWLFQEFRPPVTRRETASLTPAMEAR